MPGGGGMYPVGIDWHISLGFNPVVTLIAMCLVIHWREALTWRTELCWYCTYKYHFMPNDNYSIDFQVYRIDLSFFTRELLVSRICGGECWWDEPFMQFVIDNKALAQADSKLNTLVLWSQIIWYTKTLLHTNKNPVHMHEAWVGAMVLLAFDHFLARCLWQKDAIRADAKCQTYIVYNDFFLVQRELLKDGILLCLQNCIFQLPSYRLKAAFSSKYTFKRVNLLKSASFLNIPLKELIYWKVPARAMFRVWHWFWPLCCFYHESSKKPLQ